MRKAFLFVALASFIAAPASANFFDDKCTDFKSCMEASTDLTNSPNGGQQLCAQRAIAFKLDEISKQRS